MSDSMGLRGAGSRPSLLASSSLWGLTAIGGFALVQALGAAPALAQTCNSSANPSPPTVANINASGVTYTPQSPLADGQPGDVGCDGIDGNQVDNHRGGDGSVGAPGPTFTATYGNVDVLGVTSVDLFVARIRGDGGNGGRGGNSGSVDSGIVDSGNGGAGGQGGSPTVNFSGSIGPAANVRAIGGGLEFSAEGGGGGAGGDSSDQGIFLKHGGKGGDGGAGGTAALSLPQGKLTAASTVFVGADGGPGGRGGTALTIDVLDTVEGGKGGAGGAGGSASATIGPNAVFDAATDSAAEVSANGGAGGMGGRSGSDPNELPAIGATGGSGGAGGRAGNATVDFGGVATLEVFPGDTSVVSVVAAEANGGRGGDGNTANGSLNAGGGSGAAGGAGGAANLTFSGIMTATAPAGSLTPGGQGLLAQATAASGASARRRRPFRASAATGARPATVGRLR